MRDDFLPDAKQFSSSTSRLRIILVTTTLAISVLIMVFYSAGFIRQKMNHRESAQSGRTTGVPPQNNELREDSVFEAMAGRPEKRIARIVRLKNVQWKNPEKAKSEWQYLKKGEKLQLESGAIEIVFDVGVQLIVEGPANMNILDSKRVQLSYGKMAVRVSHGGAGFTILTPSGKVVDLGTEFGLDVNHQGESKVIVFNGRVDVYPHQDQADSFDFSNSRKPVVLSSGESLIFRQNAAPEPVAVVESDYFLPAAISRPPVSVMSQSVITSVRDNIRDGQSKKFYQIVPRGFGEDVLAYVDRLHEWNGVTTEGLPAFLVGGDMIRTFNDDKYQEDYRLTVTLSAPARFFVLFDRRSTIPDWLIRDFQATNHIVGLDESRYPHDNERLYDQYGFTTPEERTPARLGELHIRGLGPGKSVDFIFRV